jgi:uncharacterized protein
MKIEVIIRFYEELNRLLSPYLQKKDFTFQIESKTSIQQLLDKLNIPLSIIDLILVNGVSAGLKCQLNDGDRISIYPVFETFNIAPLSLLHVKPLRRLRFICDDHLGKLAKYMRALGFDVLYNNNFQNHQVIDTSIEQKRIILTKDKLLIKNHRITRAYLVKESDSRKQLSEIVLYFDLFGCIDPLSRCLRCNNCVQPATKESIKNYVPASILNMHDCFKQCDSCKRIYWMGSHYDSMMNWIGRIG